MQNNHQHNSAGGAQQHNKPRIRYDNMQSQQQQQHQQQQQQQQQQYNQRFRPQGGGNIPRQQQHPNVAQAQQQQGQTQVVQVQAQQIPQAARVQQPQVTSPQYGAYPGGPVLLQYNPQSQTIAAPQGFRLASYPTVPSTFYPAQVQYNHLQQWQIAQTHHQLQQQAQANAVQQQYYQTGVQVPTHIIQQQQPGGTQQYYTVRGIAGQQHPTFVQGPPLQPSSAAQQVQVQVQAQQTHQAHHVQQHPPQSHQPVQGVGILQVSGVNQVQQQPEPRENVQPPPQRKRNVLQIVDPNTGKSVFGDAVDVSPHPSAADSDTTQAVTVSNDEPATVSINSTLSPAQNLVPTPEVSPAEEKPVEKTKARSEFFQKISQLGDDGSVSPGRSGNGETVPQQTPTSTTASSTTETSPPPSSPVPSDAIHDLTVESDSASATTEGEHVETLEEDTQQVQASPSFNGTADSVQEASLCSISPTPIEKYITSPEPIAPISHVPIPAPVELLESRESSASPEPSVPEIEESPAPEVVSPPSEKNDEIPIDSLANNQLGAETEEKLTEAIEEEIMADENKTSDIEALQNGIVEIEVADEEPNDEIEEEDELMEEGEINENEDSTTQSSGVKQRICYDREQLLNFKQSKESQLDIQSNIPADLFKDPKTSNSSNVGHSGFKPGSSPGGGLQHMSGRIPMPPMNRNRNDGRMVMQPGGRQGGGGWGMGQGMGAGPFQVPPPFQNPKPPVVIHLQREPVKLHKAETPWKPSTGQSRSQGMGNLGNVGNVGNEAEEKDDEELIQADVVKKTRGILNKLTPENFDKLVNKFLQLKLEDKDERIGSVIHVVFEKAIDEPSFSTAYAKMVKTVCDKSQETAKKFRKQILDQCQKEFQKGNTDEEEIKILEAELEAAVAAEDSKKDAIKVQLEDKRFITRRRRLGNVRFIGELYKLQMLTPKIMVECINMLMSTSDEESYECLCKLLTTIGQKLEDQLRESEMRAAEIIKKGQTPKWSPIEKFMDKTFANLKSLSGGNKLSSRIRFALLDAYELRENGWKPRRDAAGPKTIDEVRRDAVRQDQEEKRQLQNLTPAPLPVGRQGQPTPPKKGEWNTVSSSNKSSRFQNVNKKPVGAEPSSGNVLLGPQGGLWSRGPTSQSPLNKPPQNIPPRMERERMMNNNQNKFAPLSTELPPAPRTPYRHEIVQTPPPSIRTPPFAGNTSRESSRPQTPTREHPPPPVEEEVKELPLELSDKDRQVVKNILEEFVSIRKLEDTLDWIQLRFKGQRIHSFIEELSRLAGDLSKEEHQKAAGSLISTLVKKNIVSKLEVIKILQDGVMADLPDIEVDVPKATSYLAVFLVELFYDEVNLSWLLEFETKFEDYPDTWANLTSHTLNILKLRRSEGAVQHLFKQTNEANRFPIQGIPWVAGETLDSLSKKMIKVLEEDFPKQSDSFHLCTETFDLRDELTSKSLIQALCVVCWKGVEWDLPRLEKILNQVHFPLPDHIPLLWKQAQEFINTKQIDKDNENQLWKLMNKVCLIDSSNKDIA